MPVTDTNYLGIKYDRSLPIVGLGMSPFYRIGPEKWFDNYRIISYTNWDIPSTDWVHAITDLNSDVLLDPMNTQSLVESKEFMQIVKNQKLEAANFITYRPIKFNAFSSITDEATSITQTFENKKWFRQSFAEDLPFPNFAVHVLEDIKSKSFTEITAFLSGNSAVLQHEQLSGGRGTFIITNQSELEKAVTFLINHKQVSKLDSVVISEYIPLAKELSFQACITKFGTFIGPPQKQFVRDPDLVNVDNLADQFCGGVISDSLISTHHFSNARQHLQLVADNLKSAGYTGIFGMDFLIDENENVFVIEVNARMTGMLPLLVQNQKKYPFLLLHILERTNQDYTLLDNTDLSHPETINDAAFVVLHDKLAKKRPVHRVPESGIYQKNENNFQIIDSDIYINKNQLLLHNFLRSGYFVRPNARIASIYSSTVDIHAQKAGIPLEFINWVYNAYR